jgi:lysophospholipase L1-like esterase
MLSLQPRAALRKLRDLFGATPAKAPAAPGLLDKFEAFLRETAAPYDALYLGDSVVERVSRDDQDTRTLARMVEDDLRGDVIVRSLTHSALHAHVYAALARAIATMDARPRLFVVPVNLRSFSPQWALSPDWQFAEELAALREHIRGRGGAADFRWPAPLTAAQFEAARVQYVGSNLATVGQFREIIRSQPADEAGIRARRQAIFTFHYMAELEAGDTRLRALAALAEAAEAMGARALLYVTPVNAEAGAELLGEEFLAVQRANVATIRQALSAALERGAVHLLDYSEAMSAAGFFHRYEPTEHLNQDGRRRIAAMLAEEIRAATLLGNTAGVG